MTPPERAAKLLAAADALSVVCDQLEELALPDLAKRVALYAARLYRRAASHLQRAGDTQATFAYASASDHYGRAGRRKDMAVMRDRALDGLPRTTSISLNGKPLEGVLVDPPKRKR